MTEIHELRIPYSDASRIAVRCGNCQAELVIDLMELPQVARIAGLPDEKNIPHDLSQEFNCPFCSMRVDSFVRIAVQHLRNAFAGLKEHGQQVSFCVQLHKLNNTHL
jgi:hypothetical protein